MRAKCNHVPRRLVATSTKHKDGSPQMICADCLSTWRKRAHRKKQGYDEWWDRQQGLCALCNQKLVDDNTTHLDHDHVTGRKRGLVHAYCNLMIGGIENAVALAGWDAILRHLRD